MLLAGINPGARRMAASAIATPSHPASRFALGGARSKYTGPADYMKTAPDYPGPPAAEPDEQFSIKLSEDATLEQVQKLRDVEASRSKRFAKGGRYALQHFLPKNQTVSADSPMPRPLPLPIRRNIKVRRTGKSDWNNFMTPTPNGDGTSTVPIKNSTRGRINRSQVGTKPLAIPIKPSAHAVAQTEVPHNVVELVQRYPRHPLFKFFDLIPVGEADHSIKYRGPVNKENDEKNKESYGNIVVPVTLHDGYIGSDPSARPWEASELRLKSSFELHQLWYLCVFERNKLSTAWAEARRCQLYETLNMAQQNITRRLYQLRWTQLRIKAVLHERAETLLDAQALEDARRHQAERETTEQALGETPPRRGRQYRRRADEPPAGAIDTTASPGQPTQPQA